MAKRSIVSVDEYTSFVPGLSFNRAGFGDRNGLDLTVRGVSNSRIADATAGTGALTTGFYIDDIAVQPVDVWMYDIRRLEVLKGPQGTLFGQASMGGTLRIITNEPDASEFAASSEMTASRTRGGDPSWGLRGMVNLPLISDSLALRLVAYNDEQGGFVDWNRPGLEATAVRGLTPDLPEDFPDPQVAAGSQRVNNVNSQSTLGFRGQLQYTPNDKLTVTPFYMFQEKDTAFLGEIDRNLNAGFINERYVPEPRLERFSQAAITIDYDFSGFTLTSITGRFHRDYEWTQDATTFLADRLGRLEDGSIASLGFFDAVYDTAITSQELRLTSARSDFFDWVVGAAYFDEERSVQSFQFAPTFNANAPPAQHIPGGDNGLFIASRKFNTYQNKSVFGDVAFRLFEEQLELSLGFRAYDQSFATSSAVTGAGVGSPGAVRRGLGRSGGDDGVIPRLALKYSIGSDQIIYVSAAKGFRGGGPGAAPRELQTPACLDALERAGVEPGGSFQSDDVNSYELGTKIAWANQRITTDMALFYIDWSDLQTNVFMDNLNRDCSISVVMNVGTARIQGAELALEAQVAEDLTLSTAVTYTDAQLLEFPVGSVLGSTGDQVQNVPEWQAVLGAEYGFTILGNYSGFIRTDVSYYGEQISNQIRQDSPFFHVPDRTVINGRLGFGPTDGKWEVELFVDNALDETIMFGAQELFGERFTNQALVGRPQTVGLLLRNRW